MAAAKKPMPESLHCAPADMASTETSLRARQTVVIGRGKECDVVISDVKASRRHCRLTRGEDWFELEDLGSKNGTFVEGKRIREAVVLRSNQTFKVGDTVFYLS